MTVSYLHLPFGVEPPDIGSKRPYRAVVLLEQETSAEWRGLVSDWLVRSGCLCMMAWGKDCEAFHDSVDRARDAPFDGLDIPDDQFVMTTWHDNEPLAETLWFSEHAAFHPTVLLDETIVIDVGTLERRAVLTEMVHTARKRKF